ncbi:hypothetical protein FRB90_001805 [Tulasnella sp. 427]|nr:hypothetical protein FRB90_001805 [Tulasnella sp. 427]
MYDESFLIIIPDVVLRKELPRLRSDVRTANKVLPGGTKITSTVGELAAVALQWIWNAMESDYSQFVRIQDVQDVSVSLTRSDDDLILQCLIQILKATPSISRDASFLLTADIDLRRKTLGYGVRANSPGPAASASSFARTLKININGQQPTLSLQALLRVPKAQSQKRKRGDSASFSPQTSAPWHPHGNDATPCFCKSTITKLSSSEAFGAYLASAIQGFQEVAHHPNVPSIPDEFATELSTCKGLSANSLLEALTPHRVYILSFEFLVTRLEIIKELFRNLCQSAHTPYNILFVLPGMVSGQIDEYKKRGPGCNIWNFDGVQYDAGEVAREVDTWLIHVLEGAGRRWMVCQQEVEDDIPTYQWRQSLDAALKIRDATRRRIAQIRVLYECALKFHRLMKSIRAREY